MFPVTHSTPPWIRYAFAMQGFETSKSRKKQRSDGAFRERLRWAQSLYDEQVEPEAMMPPYTKTTLQEYLDRIEEAR